MLTIFFSFDMPTFYPLGNSGSMYIKLCVEKFTKLLTTQTLNNKGGMIH